MALETRELYSSSNGDQWYLARDTASGEVFIHHKANAASGGHESRIEIRTFLSQGPQGAEHHELMRLIGTLVEGSSDA